MTGRKRVFDVVFVLILLLPLMSVMALIAGLILMCDGRPILHRSERMRAPGQAFTLWKFRTMRPVAGGDTATGGDKQQRITRLGHLLRARRLDELPQLWNVLRGDVSFVGPRPPLRAYVERFPQLYAPVLRCRPGVTGLASLRFYQQEERLLAHCRNAAETDEIYTRRCLPAKARLDMFYLAKQSLVFDLWIIWRTARDVVFGQIPFRGLRLFVALRPLPITALLLALMPLQRDAVPLARDTSAVSPASAGHDEQ